jgi:hypothetical protein
MIGPELGAGTAQWDPNRAADDGEINNVPFRELQTHEKSRL